MRCSRGTDCEHHSHLTPTWWRINAHACARVHGCRKPVDVGSLLRFKSHVVDVQYKPASKQQQQGEEEAHIAVEVAAVISHPEQRDTTHTNSFRCVAAVSVLGWCLQMPPVCGVWMAAGSTQTCCMLFCVFVQIHLPGGTGPRPASPRCGADQPGGRCAPDAAAG